MSTKTYRPWNPRQSYLLPPSPDEWLPDGHLAFFVLDLVTELELSAIEGPIQARDPRGEKPFDPRMMVALLLYAYTVGLPSSRRISRATYEDVAFRVISGGEHPHFTRICAFRREHFMALKELFGQVLRLCQSAGLVKLGHVSIDGSKFKANASKHKAMSYDRMQTDKDRLEAEVDALLKRAEAVDEAEDELYGEGVQPEDLPEELRRREGRLAKIRAAMAALEEEAKEARAAQLMEQAEGHRRTAATHPIPRVRKAAATNAAKREQAARELLDDDSDDEPPPGGASTGDLPLFSATASEPPKPGEDKTATPLPEHRPKATAEGKPHPKAQRNFTDPDSRIMELQGGFIQGYNGQIAVDEDHQVIVADALTNQAPDTYHLVPLLERTEANCGALPSKTTADTGYWAPSNAQWCEDHRVDAYISTGRMKRGWSREPPARGDPDPDADARERMRHKVNTDKGREIYKMRKCIPEPVFGQIKEARGFRQLLHRGIQKARCEFSLICTGHNILKLFRNAEGGRFEPAWAR
jgi:transposase